MLTLKKYENWLKIEIFGYFIHSILEVFLGNRNKEPKRGWSTNFYMGGPKQISKRLLNLQLGHNSHLLLSKTLTFAANMAHTCSDFCWLQTSVGYFLWPGKRASRGTCLLEHVIGGRLNFSKSIEFHDNSQTDKVLRRAGGQFFIISSVRGTVKSNEMNILTVIRYNYCFYDIFTKKIVFYLWVSLK